MLVIAVCGVLLAVVQSSDGVSAVTQNEAGVIHQKIQQNDQEQVASLPQLAREAEPAILTKPAYPHQSMTVGASYQHVSPGQGIKYVPQQSYRNAEEPIVGSGAHVQVASPVYKNYQQGAALQAANPGHATVIGTFLHPKDANKKKATAQDLKPSYYPKEMSSYSTIPDQPMVNTPVNTARFVANPAKKQLIEEMSESQLQQLTYKPLAPQYPAGFMAHPAPAHLHYGGAPVPYNQVPFVGRPQETATVSYEKTNHGLIDRMWGEVQTMRQAIATDFFGAIPNFFRNIWTAIVGAVSSASARMLSLDWASILQTVRDNMQ